MRRAVLVVLVVLAVARMEHQLSDGEPHPLGRRAPELWAPAYHAPSAAAPPGTCVLAIPLDAGGTFVLTSPENGVDFDLDANASRERVSWTEAGAEVAWLAVDRNDDGRIISGRELVGDRMLPEARSAPEALITLGSERRPTRRSASLTGNDAEFRQLLLWTDRNHNGVSETNELRSARDVFSDIGLGFQRHHRRDPHGNESRYRGFAHIRTAPGRNRPTGPDEDAARLRWMYDACLVAR